MVNLSKSNIIPLYKDSEACSSIFPIFFSAEVAVMSEIPTLSLDAISISLGLILVLAILSALVATIINGSL